MSWCVAEDEEGGAPWLPLATERGVPDGVSAVTAFAASGPRQIMNEWTTDPAEILTTVVAEIKATMLHYSIWAGNYAVVFPPQLRAVFHGAGWSKADVRQFVYDHAVVQAVATGRRSARGRSCPTTNRHREYRARCRRPRICWCMSAGGEAGGFAAVIPPWLGPEVGRRHRRVGVCVDC